MATLKELEKYLDYEFSTGEYRARLQDFSKQVYKLFENHLHTKQLATCKCGKKSLLLYRFC